MLMIFWISMHFYLGSLNIDSRLNFPIELSPAVLRELVGQKQSVFLVPSFGSRSLSVFVCTLMKSPEKVTTKAGLLSKQYLTLMCFSSNSCRMGLGCPLFNPLPVHNDRVPGHHCPSISVYQLFWKIPSMDFFPTFYLICLRFSFFSAIFVPLNLIWMVGALCSRGPEVFWLLVYAIYGREFHERNSIQY